MLQFRSDSLGSSFFISYFKFYLRIFYPIYRYVKITLFSRKQKALSSPFMAELWITDTPSPYREFLIFNS